MKVTVDRTPESEAVLNIELDWAEVEKASDRAYRKLVQKYNVPGFRRGKAPRPMLERMLGKDTLYQEGIEDLVDESVKSAVKDHQLRPLTRPSLDMPPIEHGQPYAFTARLPIFTPVELGDYKTLSVERSTVEVTEDDIKRILENIQQDNAMWLPAERPAQIGDKVTMDLKVTSGDRTISDLHDNEFELTSERPGIFSGMDQQVTGMRDGETKEFTTTIPEDYANTELAGKEAQFTVILKGIKYRELPELDDELAKSIGDYTTLDEVRQAIHDQLLESKRTQADRDLQDRVVTAVADQAKVEIHPVLVDDEVHIMMRETERTLAQNRISLQQYLSITNKTEEQYHTELEPVAKERVRRDLVLSAVADAEDVDISDDEIEAWLARISGGDDGKPIHLRQLNADQRANVVARMRRDKALERLIELIATDAPAAGEATSEATASATKKSERNAKAAAKAAVSTDTAPATVAKGEAQPAAKGATPAKGEASPAAEAAEAETADTKPAATGGAAKKRSKHTEVPESEP